MLETAKISRQFKVRARHEDGHHGRLVSEPTFEAAAIAYVEHLHLRAGDPSAVGVIVHDLANGHEHSFTIHLDTHEATPTG